MFIFRVEKQTVDDRFLGIPKNVNTDNVYLPNMNCKKFMRDRVLSAVAIIAFVLLAGLLV